MDQTNGKRPIPICACGTAGVKMKGGLGVCGKCDEIEQKMYGRRAVSSGMKKFPNREQYVLGDAVETNHL